MTELAPPHAMPEILAQLSGSARLSSRAQATAARLLHRLISPVRIGIFAPSPEDGAALAGLLLEREVTALPGVPTRLTFGETAQMFWQFPDRDALQIQDRDTLPARPEGACGLVIEAPHEMLRDTAIDVLPHNDCASLLGSVDMALWCSRQFEAAEHALWVDAPDALKDHSFLIGLDPPAEAGSKLDAHLQAASQELFLAFVPVPLEGAGSEGDDLRTRLLQRAKLGIQSHRDRAALFIEKHKAEFDFNHLPAKTAPPDTPTAVTERSIATVPEDAISQASRYLRARARDLAATPLADDAQSCATVLRSCAETAETLSGLFVDQAGSAPDDVAFADEILTAADGVVLMSLEESMASAVDAVTVLMQIGKDLHMRAAA